MKKLRLSYRQFCIFTAGKDKLLEKAQRIFEFGFAVGNGRVEIATITDSFKVRLKNRSYKVRVQLWSEHTGTDLCYVSFLENRLA